MDERVKNDMGALAATLDFDAELMLRVKDGDGASFAILLEKHRLPVIHFLYRMVQNQAVAEELAQEVFLRVYRSPGELRTDGQIHHLAVSDCHPFSVEFAAGREEPPA